MDNAGQASTDRRSSHLLGCHKETNMTKLNLLAYPLVAVLSLAAAGTAFADDPTPDHTAAVPSLKTRSQVQSELFAARADGSVKVWSTSYNPLRVARSTKTRDQVRAERDATYAQQFYGEDSGSFVISRARPVLEAAATYASAK